MKIVVLSWFYPPVVGGAERIAQASVAALRAAGHQVQVLTAATPGRSRFPDPQVTHLDYLHPLRRGEYDRITLRQLLAQAFDPRKTDLVYSHNLALPLYPNASLALLDLCEQHGIPLVEHAHTLPRSSRIFRQLNRLDQSLVLTVSGYLKQEIERFLTIEMLPTPPIKTFHNPVDTRIFHPKDSSRKTTRRRFSWGEKDIGVLFPSRLFDINGDLSEAKRPREAIQAFLEAAAVEPDLKLLVIAPDGFAGNSRRSRAAADLRKLVSDQRMDSRVHFLGQSQDSQGMARLYRAADLTLIPSRETFGLCTGESMACGTPVIGLDAGGTRELAGQAGGYLVMDGPQLVSDLAKSLVTLARDLSSRQSMSSEAVRHVQQHFSSMKWAGHLRSLIEVMGARAVRS